MGICGLEGRVETRENTYPRPIYRGAVEIFPSPRSYIQGHISESKEIFLNMTSLGDREAWLEGRVPEMFDGGSEVWVNEKTYPWPISRWGGGRNCCKLIA